MVVAVSEVVWVSPITFVTGVALGFWIGGRYIIRKHNGKEEV